VKKRKLSSGAKAIAKRRLTPRLKPRPPKENDRREEFTTEVAEEPQS